MKRVSSIYRIFIIFLVMIMASFLLIYRYSAANLKLSLRRTAEIQMDYSSEQLSQKLKELELEAGSIEYSDELKRLQVAIVDEADIYDYVMAVSAVKEMITRHQSQNSGMAECILYWPENGRIVTSSVAASVDKEMLEGAEEGAWSIVKDEAYFVGRYHTTWAAEDDEPYVIIRLERDWLYRIKSVASGFEQGGTMYLYEGGQSMFPLSTLEKQLREEIRSRWEDGKRMWECRADGVRYQLVLSEMTRSGLMFATYYPLRGMMLPVWNITYFTVGALLLVLLVGGIFLVMYYKNILLQLNMLTYKLSQVEKGDLSTQIEELPDNEFHYVFTQFNEMTQQMDELFTTTLKEQELRNQAELKQLQLQINPHFLYNSLSYIVTMAEHPEQVRDMAVHLSEYYRYCSRKKQFTTIGEEVSYAKSYLAIMAMRKQITYAITAEESLLEIPVIPLLLEPLIENAIEHGIEERETANRIEIRIYRLAGSKLRAEVWDDGNGMSDADIRRLTERIRKRERDETESVGLWNVNQRLANFYSESAQLCFENNDWGGLKVYFTISAGKAKGRADESINRG